METPNRLLQLLDEEAPALNVEAALTRVRASQPARRDQRLWPWPVAVLAGIFSVLIAQQTMSLFEVRKVVPLRYPAGDLPPELMLPNVLPMFPADKVKTTRAATVAEATVQAGYPVRTIRSPLLRYEPSFRVEQYPVVERTIDRAKIEAALASRGAPPIPFPERLNGGTVAVRARGPAVLSHYGSCPRVVGPWDACAFLIQQYPPSLALPPGVDPGEFMEFSLRLIGRTAAEARARREHFPGATALFLPLDESMLDVTTVPLRRGTGTLVRYKPTNGGQAFSLHWEEAGQLFTLVGRDPSQAAMMANSLEP